MPKFRDIATWQQAEHLMQPTFIRLIDNLRKQLDESAWRGTYEDVPIWESGVSEDVKARVLQLRSELNTAATPETAAAIEQMLADLPAPHSGYLLHLRQAEQQVTVDLWELCYQICFRDYDVVTGTSRSRGFGQPPSDQVEVDTSLLDSGGEVDWTRLDEKARKLVERVFAELPEVREPATGEQAG